MWFKTWVTHGLGGLRFSAWAEGWQSYFWAEAQEDRPLACRLAERRPVFHGVLEGWKPQATDSQGRLSFVSSASAARALLARQRRRRIGLWPVGWRRGVSPFMENLKAGSLKPLTAEDGYPPLAVPLTPRALLVRQKLRRIGLWPVGWRRGVSPFMENLKAGSLSPLTAETAILR